MVVFLLYFFQVYLKILYVNRESVTNDFLGIEKLKLVVWLSNSFIHVCITYSNIKQLVKTITTTKSFPLNTANSMKPKFFTENV